MKVELLTQPVLSSDNVTTFFKRDLGDTIIQKSQKILKGKRFFSEEKASEIRRTLPLLLPTLSLCHYLVIELEEDFQLNGNEFLKEFQRYYPQIVWVSASYEKQRYELVFVPIVIKEEGFPLGFSLQESLIQQSVESNTPIIEWEKEIQYTLQKYVYLVEKASEPADNKIKDYGTQHLFVKKEKIYADKTRRQKKKFRLNISRSSQLTDQVRQLQQENNLLKKELEQIEDINKEGSILELKDKKYFEQALKQAIDTKERMRLSKEKLEYEITRLEKKVMDGGLDLLEDLPYVDRKENWYKLKKIPLQEYDQLYQKSKYLEYTWKVNQQLNGTTERMVFEDEKVIYERERVKKIKESAKDIELFVMMDECQKINERVRIKKKTFWRKPVAKILTGDYENLVEKAAYFDILQSENSFLEKMIEEKKVKVIN